MSNLLINEPPLQVLPTLAKLIGLNEAIALQQLHYWIENPKTEGEVDEDGNKWIYNSYENWQKDNFPFWSVSTVRRVFQNLENGELVISAQLKAKQRDMTKYYRINHEMLDTMHQPNLNTSSGSKRADVNHYTETTPENTTKIEGASLDWALGHDQPVTENDLNTSKVNDEAPKKFEQAFGFGSLPWDSNSVWEKFRKFVTDIYSGDRLAFGNYVVWRGGEGKYKAMSNKQIRMNPQIFMDTGWMEFINRVASQPVHKGIEYAMDWLSRVEGEANGN